MNKKIIQDSHYVIGSSHLECQDYASSGDDPFPYVIVSDGCSGSIGSDIGARCLVRYLESSSFLEEIFSINPSQLINQIAEIHPWDFEVFDATLLSLTLKNNVCTFDAQGDGVLIKKYPDNKYSLTVIEYVSNAPFYSSYYLSPERTQQYLNHFGGVKKIITYDVSVKELNFTKSEEVINFSSCLPSEKRVLNESTWTDLCWYHESFSVDNLGYVAIASDGLLSLFKKGCDQTEELLLLEAIPSLLDFKSFVGPFVKRRLNSFSTRENKIRHSDDLSLGVIALI